MKLVLISLVIALRKGSEGVELWLQTRDSDDDLNGLLEFPGGKIERGESPEDAAARELVEEVGVQADPRRLKLFNIYNHSYPEKTVSLYTHLMEVEGSNGFPEEGWVKLDASWKDVYAGRIPEANLRIFNDLAKEFLT